MKKLLTLVLFSLSFSLFAQSTPTRLTSSTFNKAINTGVVVVEFGAKFAQSFDSWNELTDCKYYRVDIETSPELKDKYRIRTVPTIIVFNNGEKEAVFKANIMLELEATPEDIQEEIDELLSDKF